MYAFTNHFSGPTLRQRISMINGRRSGPFCWWRYVVWIILMGTMVFACRHKQDGNTFLTNLAANSNALPATSPTRAIVVNLEDKGTWYRHLALFHSKFGTEAAQSEPVILQVKGNQFVLSDDYKYSSDIYINGKSASVEDLQKLSPEFISELFVMHQFENMAGIDTQAKPYQILIQTTPQPIRFDGIRKQFFTLLQAASISQHPLGESFSFNMNQLLEATFFHNKNALVERTKNEHLSVYDDFAKTVDVFINNLPATPADVKTIHVREVARLYTKERPYTVWFRTDNPSSRFELYIQTSPKRAKRDSSYYVFSPFYSGDF